MWDDFDDNDFNEEDAEEFRNERDKMKNHPLRTKSLEIFELTHALVGSLDEARRELYGTLMMESAGLLGAKFSAAHGVDDYILKMENATVMKVHARHLYSITFQLAMEETHAEEHLNLLRTAIEEFRALFVEWVRTFDREERQDDGWGLFLD